MKKPKIQKLIADGISVRQVARRLDTTEQYVKCVKLEMEVQSWQTKYYQLLDKYEALREAVSYGGD